MLISIISAEIEKKWLNPTLEIIFETNPLKFAQSCGWNQLIQGWVGFWVLRSYLGRVSGYQDLFQVKLGLVFFLIFSQFCQYLAKKFQYLWKGGGIARVRFLGQVLTQPIPRQYHILKTSRKNRSNHCIYYTISKVSYYILSSIVN